MISQKYLWIHMRDYWRRRHQAILRGLFFPSMTWILHDTAGVDASWLVFPIVFSRAILMNIPHGMKKPMIAMSIPLNRIHEYTIDDS